jgi:phosphoglycerate kinase
MTIKTIKDIDVAGKRVLVRADFNVPLADGEVADDSRIRATLPTIEYLLDQNARVILCSHLGRPKGRVDEELRLDPVADRLAELLDRRVAKIDDCIGEQVAKAVEDMEPGDLLLLENTRFHPEEKENHPDFAANLANGADLYVNDAFAAAHRAHASTEGVAHHLPAVAGLLLEREIEALQQVREHPEPPFVVIMGGAKISDKINVLDHFRTKADFLLIGGGMANTFLKAKGVAVGESLVEEESLDEAKRILDEAGDKLILPVDVVVAESQDEDAERKSVSVDDVPQGWQILDIGPETVDLFKEKLQDASTVLWNGPLGLFEKKPFAEGTYAIAKTLATLDAKTFTGGGETIAAVAESGVTDKITHVSTGGGAFLNFMEGKELPGIAALEDA